MRKLHPFAIPVLLLAGAAAAAAAEPALSELGQGITAYNSRDFTLAISRLRAAQNETPALADYLTYYLGWSELLTNDVDGAIRLLNAYRANPIDSSPLSGKLTLLYSRALLDKHDPDVAAKALNALQTDYKSLPQPDGDFALALAYEALGEKPQAALTYEKVFYEFPNTDLAAQSSAAMDRLRLSLGKDFPTASPRQELDRCQKWLDARQYLKARQEYSSLENRLEGPDREAAKVGIGKSDFLLGDTSRAFHYLQDLHVTDPAVDAERLYYLAEASRKLGDQAEMTDAVRRLGELAPQSPWRLKALISAGNQYLVWNQPAEATPLFKAAAETFSDDNAASYAHWKVAWDAYLNNKADRTTLLREQIERYPDDSRSGAALYFLGRVAEADAKYGEARAYYERLDAQFPHYFYAVLARRQLRDKVIEAEPDDASVMWLQDVDWPEHRDLSATEPNAATERRIGRARLLTNAGLPDLADAELRFGAKDPHEQPQLLALESAQSSDSAFRALRVMKSFSGDYLALPIDKAPVKFWQMLFPLPYKDELFVNARERGLDPFDVAALIRQESEFNPGAKSPANARGLMQIEPSTGRMLGRQQGMVVSASSLFNPVVSLRLGTEYLSQQLGNWGGDWFRTLAAYDAGPNRVRQWLAGANYREPVEFLESIPFNETREYVQAVLRNADMYRELYAKAKIPVLDSPAPSLRLVSVTETRKAAPARTKRRVSHSSARKTAAKKPAPKKTVSTQAAASQKKHDPA